MANGYESAPARRGPDPSWDEVKFVQNLIEQCLVQYIGQSEIAKALQLQAGVDPSFTGLVWQKLEEQNPQFFRLYGIMVQLKAQTIAFNLLVKRQMKITLRLKSGEKTCDPIAVKVLPPNVCIDPCLSPSMDFEESC